MHDKTLGTALACTVLPFALACSRAAGTTAASVTPAAAPASIQIESGQVAGVEGADRSIAVFKGIPYAAPPVGGPRWRPPQPPVPWSGVRSASTFSKSCTQELRRSLLPWTEEFMLGNDVSEDCLALNVWVPARAVGAAAAALPVYVYLHGGAFTSG